jgi:hypothetical protein
VRLKEVFVRVFLILCLLLQSTGLQTLSAQGLTDPAAYSQIVAQKNPQTKKKLALNFEKNFPKSKRLPDVYIELTRLFVGESDFTTAKQYAEKAVSTVQKMKTQPAPPENTEATWHQWLNTVDASAKKNLDWANQMAAWQQEQLRSSLHGKR